MTWQDRRVAAGVARCESSFPNIRPPSEVGFTVSSHFQIFHSDAGSQMHWNFDLRWVYSVSHIKF